MGGSYLTMFSKGGFIFGIINIIGNFGTVFVDQVRSSWESVILATPLSSLTTPLILRSTVQNQGTPCMHPLVCLLCIHAALMLLHSLHLLIPSAAPLEIQDQSMDLCCCCMHAMVRARILIPCLNS